MDILIIHQNFPGQYKHLAPELARRGHRVVALTPRAQSPGRWQGVQLVPYTLNRGSSREIHPWLADLESKVVRADCCHAAALRLRAKGFMPRVILAHHGWGEPMFLKDVWPEARLGLYAEFHYRPEYPYSGFDPEFDPPAPGRDALRLRLRNVNNRLHEEICDLALSPTRFQAQTFPPAWQDRMRVIHDGIDTSALRPDPGAVLRLEGGPELRCDDEVISFVNRNLEPLRGYHVFMRALPELLRRRPRAQVVIVGGDDVSYGPPPERGTWKQRFIDEVSGDIPPSDWERVHFTGRLPYGDFQALLQVTSAHVYLTYPFVLSWSLLEAMSLGAPIVASDTAPVREAIRDGENGLLVDFFDRAALLAAIDAVIDGPELARRLGAAARDTVVRGYDLQKVCLPAQLAFVEELAALEPRPPLP